MGKHDVPIQSLIDHIKTSMDIDPWAKEMAEELLKKHIPKPAQKCSPANEQQYFRCYSCAMFIIPGDKFCHKCGQAVKWDA